MVSGHQEMPLLFQHVNTAESRHIRTIENGVCGSTLLSNYSKVSVQSFFFSLSTK